MYFYQSTTKGDDGMELGLFCEMIGVTLKILYDGAPRQVGPNS